MNAWSVAAGLVAAASPASLVAGTDGVAKLPPETVAAAEAFTAIVAISPGAEATVFDRHGTSTARAHVGDPGARWSARSVAEGQTLLWDVDGSELVRFDAATGSMSALTGLAQAERIYAVEGSPYLVNVSTSRHGVSEIVDWRTMTTIDVATLVDGAGDTQVDPPSVLSDASGSVVAVGEGISATTYVVQVASGETAHLDGMPVAVTESFVATADTERSVTTVAFFTIDGSTIRSFELERTRYFTSIGGGSVIALGEGGELTRLDADHDAPERIGAIDVNGSTVDGVFSTMHGERFIVRTSDAIHIYDAAAVRIGVIKMDGHASVNVAGPIGGLRCVSLRGDEQRTIDTMSATVVSPDYSGSWEFSADGCTFAPLTRTAPPVVVRDSVPIEIADAVYVVEVAPGGNAVIVATDDGYGLVMLDNPHLLIPLDVDGATRVDFAFVSA